MEDNHLPNVLSKIRIFRAILYAQYKYTAM